MKEGGNISVLLKHLVPVFDTLDKIDMRKHMKNLTRNGIGHLGVFRRSYFSAVAKRLVLTDWKATACPGFQRWLADMVSVLHLRGEKIHFNEVWVPLVRHLHGNSIGTFLHICHLIFCYTVWLVSAFCMSFWFLFLFI